MIELSEDLKSFLRQHEHADVNELLLKNKTILGYSASFVADQISARKKAKHKLPTFFNNQDIVFPPSLNLEQSSSEQTASFKADFINREIDVFGEGCDLTGGFGIDALFLSKLFRTYFFVEPNDSLIKTAQRNHQILGAENIQYLNTTAESFLTLEQQVDFIYIDPSRRSANKQKVFSLSDCEPDITTLHHTIFEKTKYLLMKASPLLDLQVGLKELRHVKSITVLSVNNECKELLFFCEKGFNDHPLISAINLERGHQEVFNFKIEEERSATTQHSIAKEFLYEPNVSILKAGAFKIIGNAYGLAKLHQHTHLYTAQELHKDFPGRIFRIIGEVKPEPKSVSKFFPDGKANITTRNHPLSPDELRKKTGLKDGGENYLIGYSDINRKILVAAERIA